MKKTFTRLIVIIVILAILLFLALYFNLFNLGNSLGFPLQSPNAVTQTDQGTSVDVVELVVNKETVYLGEKEVNLSDLDSQLKAYDFSKIALHLIDKEATLGTYEEVEKILINGNYPYLKKDSVK